MKHYRPLFFFSFSLLVPWALWFAAAYLSHRSDAQHYQQLQLGLSLLGLISPALLAGYLLLQNPSLNRKLFSRLFSFRTIPTRYFIMAILLLPASLILAQLLSLLLGYSTEQFVISGSPSFTSVLLSPWIMLISAAVVEELAWHSYGTDALLSRFSLFTTSIIFTLYWAIWHLPLAFIKGYYHSELVQQGAVYIINFVLSMVVFILLMNWLYMKCGRSILIAMLFHLSANLGNEIFATHPDSKIIQTLLLVILTTWVVCKERFLFFQTNHL
ncbi:CAAX protease [Pasteurellaceae bacterium Orientalotternb1]|nr:CAAX protease [Pasteurellaceae bacterium Orientalotternb1]